MALVSMTGFARVEGNHGVVSMQMEARCVNGRSSDIKLRLPSGMEHLDKPIRALFSTIVRRGNANITLSFQREATREPRINLQALESLRAALIERAKAWGDPAPQLSDLLSLPGVVEMVDSSSVPADDAQTVEQDAIILELAQQCATQLGASREGEGQAMQAVLTALVDDIDGEVSALAADPQARGDHLMARLKGQLTQLVGEASSLDPQRLHQEVALLASKADIEEELARLRAHIDAARALLAVQEPVGRKLDFLAQEFNREANTICSKSSSIGVTQRGLALKALIDQVKEQVQNIE